ncbi:hypothetical protein FBD94_15455 [Pedobacter hiemivivus]|uniref:Toxin-antitoxin system YwqK family antitoxin n=1 Tax=Pedobacter hiemivivus TaxID=2530454 RepID=A0A4U1GBK9_9SPHI|nr:hypothetical protein [Pedobacter hiemivivus]TKC60300.1 hypothetical protein FBD94_15455 [Pedobacter hiemivivus]
MIRQYIRIFLLSLFFVGSVGVAVGQKYEKDYLTHKIIVNEEDRTIVAYVKPVKQISLDTDKRYYWFSNDRIKSTQGGFSGKLLNGRYEEFYADKNLKEKGSLDKGLKSGVWKRWDEKGKLKDDYTWNLGRMDGIYHKYDSVGKVLETGKYKNDLLNGKQYTYAGTGVKELRYKDGKVVVRKKLRIPRFMGKLFDKKKKPKAA